MDLPLVGDMQASAPPVEIALSRAGVSGVQKAIRIRRGDQEILMAAEIDCTVDLARGQKGVHMSRFPELFDEAIDEAVLGEGAPRRGARRPDRVADRRAPGRATRGGADRRALAAAAADTRDRPRDAGDDLADRDRGRQRRAVAPCRRRRGDGDQCLPVRAGPGSRTSGRATGRGRLRRRRGRSDPRSRAHRDAQPARTGTLLVGTSEELDAEELVTIVEESMSAPVYSS